MGEWGSFFTVPLRGSEIVKGTMRRQATRSRNSGNFCAAENRVGRHSQLRSLGGGVGCRLGAVASKWRAHTVLHSLLGAPTAAQACPELRCRHFKYTVPLPARQRLAAFSIQVRTYFRTSLVPVPGR